MDNVFSVTCDMFDGDTNASKTSKKTKSLSFWYCISI